jgi:hypothetical protein
MYRAYRTAFLLVTAEEKWLVGKANMYRRMRHQPVKFPGFGDPFYHTKTFASIILHVRDKMRRTFGFFYKKKTPFALWSIAKSLICSKINTQVPCHLERKLSKKDKSVHGGT